MGGKLSRRSAKVAITPEHGAEKSDSGASPSGEVQSDSHNRLLAPKRLFDDPNDPLGIGAAADGDTDEGDTDGEVNLRKPYSDAPTLLF